MYSSNVKFITRTAILLALAVVFQMLGRYIPLGPNSNFIVGPLVNACLLIAASAVGLWGAAIIAFITPFAAILTGATIPLPFVPFIAIGNFLLVLCYYLLRKKRITGLMAGALLKFSFLYAAVTIFLGLAQVKPQLAAVMYFTFGWPQLVTALLGGVIALIVTDYLKKSIDL